MHAAPPRRPESDLDRRLHGTRRGAVLTELFTNSLHFPLANIFLEMLQEGVLDYLAEPDLYALLLAATAQAWFLGSWNHAGKQRQLAGNLIGPAIYTLLEAALEGPRFFLAAHHVAYWGFAFLIGSLQQSMPLLRGAAADAMLVAAHVVRTTILLVMYAIFEAAEDPASASIHGFLASDSHRYMALVIPLLGVVIGFAAVTGRRHLTLLGETATSLRRYSTWFLGASLLDDAIRDEQRLTLQRRERTVLFMDIRGFTAWSEQQSPESVVGMLNGCFHAVEAVWHDLEVIKLKHTGDEIMAVFPDPAEAVTAALAARAATAPLLVPLGLGMGAGIHQGPLVEGLIGSQQTRGYDVIGDTVNTAKRLCDNAASGELLISTPVANALGDRLVTAGTREVVAKGKQAPLAVHVVAGLHKPGHAQVPRP